MILALSGYARVGKDAFYTAVSGEYPEAVRLSFADELKKDCQIFLDMKFPGQYDVINNVKDKIFWRDLLIAWGQRCRALDAAYWIKALEEANKEVLQDKSKIKIITDCRFQNEIEWAKSLGGRVIRINRKGYTPNNPTEEKSFKEIDEKKSYDLELVNNTDCVEDYNTLCLELFDYAIGGFECL